MQEECENEVVGIAELEEVLEGEEARERMNEPDDENTLTGQIFEPAGEWELNIHPVTYIHTRRTDTIVGHLYSVDCQKHRIFESDCQFTAHPNTSDRHTHTHSSSPTPNEFKSSFTAPEQQEGGRQKRGLWGWITNAWNRYRASGWRVGRRNGGWYVSYTRRF